MRSFILFVASLVVAHHLSAGTTNILPMQPVEKGSITIEFKPDQTDGWIGTSPLHAVVYVFREEDEAPWAVELPMKKQGDRWEASYTIPERAVYIMAKVGTGKRYDTNKEMFTTVLVHGANGVPVRGANFRAGMAAFGKLPENCRRKEDMTEATEFFENEVKAHPRNITARINLDLIRVSLGTMTQEEATSEFRELTANYKQAASGFEAVAVSQALTMIGDGTRAALISRDAAQRFPTSMIAEQVSLEALQSAGNAEDFVKKCTDHLEKFPTTVMRDNIVNAVVNSAQKANQLHILVPFLERVKNLPASAYFESVNYMGAVDTLRPKALEFIDLGVVAATTEKDTRKPIFVGPSEWNESQRIQHSKLLFVRGAILNAQGKKQEAATALESSLSIGGADSEKNAYDLYVVIIKSNGDNAATLRAAERAISEGATTQNVVATYRELQRAAGKDSVTIERDLAALKKKSYAVAAERLSKEMLQRSGVDGELTSLDGKKVKLSDLKGKVVFVDYWATWCGPCKMSFPGLQKLYEKYRSNPRVAIMAVNVWEREKDRIQHVKKFLEANPSLQFPVYFDLTDAVVAKYGVTGIPTKFILDPAGRIQFKEVGYTSEEQFLEDVSMKIEMLLAQ